MSKLAVYICYSDGCPKHEPPDDDCIECAKAFWGPRLAHLKPDGTAPGGES